MSVWTHVVGAIRVDRAVQLRSNVEELTRILGPISTFDKPCKDCRLPCGSEGSLQYQIIEYGTGLPWVVIPVWGDLRDYQNEQEIREWWVGLLDSLWVRGAILRIEVGVGNAVVLSYPDSDDD